MNDTHDKSDNFVDADDFIDCFNHGCELGFEYGGKSYFAGFGRGRRFCISEVKPVDNKVEYDTAEAMLDYPVGNKRLRDILQDMTVTERPLS